MNLAIWRNAFKIDVQDLLFVWMPLYVSQQHLLRLAIKLHVQNRCVKGFNPKGMKQRVVFDFNGSGVSG